MEVRALVYVDADGVKRNAEKDTDLAASGYAIANFYPDGRADDTETGDIDETLPKGAIVVKSDEKYIPTLLEVRAIVNTPFLAKSLSLAVAADTLASAGLSNTT